MALTPSGIVWEGVQWLRGDSVADLDEYLRGRMPDEPDHRFVHPVCQGCGGDVFSLTGDAEQGVMTRACVRCILSEDDAVAERASHPICDGGDYADDADDDEYGCPCRRSEEFRLSVAFTHVDVAALDESDGPTERLVKWVYVGGMCVRCGIVGLYADWKIDYAPTDHLYDLA